MLMVLSWLHEKALLSYFPNYVSPKTNKQTNKNPLTAFSFYSLHLLLLHFSISRKIHCVQLDGGDKDDKNFKRCLILALLALLFYALLWALNEP